MASLKQALKDRESQIVSLEKFVAESERVKLIEDEWLDLEERIKRLDSVEDYRIALATSFAALDDETDGALTRLGSARKGLETIKEGDRNIADLFTRIDQARIDLRDVAAELSAQLEQFDVPPGELDRLRERRAILKQFLARHQHLLGSDSGENEALNLLLQALDLSYFY